MGALLEVKDFHYYYGNIHVVKGINLKVDKGEIVTLIGANGAGKTTTLQSISGLTPAAGVRGEIIYKGTPIQKMHGNKILRMGLSQVLEGRHIFSKLSVYENLMMGAYTRKDKAGIQEDLKRVYNLFPRLEERREQMGGTLSGGEQQMLAVGRALMAKPKMILMDEPSMGLSPLLVKEIFAIIQEVNKQGITILLVEQNAKMALAISDRAYVLETGNISIEGNAADLLNDPRVKKAYLGQ